MSASNSFELGCLTLFFQNTAYANVGDATGVRGSTAAGSFYISLHTADPGETGTAVTSETAYTSYARVPVARSSAGWTISGTTQVANAAVVTFPVCGATGSTVTHFGICATASGAGELYHSAALSSPLAVNLAITPSFAAGVLVVTAD